MFLKPFLGTGWGVFPFLSPGTERCLNPFFQQSQTDLDSFLVLGGEEEDLPSLTFYPHYPDGTYWTPLPSKPLSLASQRVRIRCGQVPVCFGLMVYHAPSVRGEAALNSISQKAPGFAVTTALKPSTTFPGRLHFPAGNAAQRTWHGEREAYTALAYLCNCDSHLGLEDHLELHFPWCFGIRFAPAMR